MSYLPVQKKKNEKNMTEIEVVTGRMRNLRHLSRRKKSEAFQVTLVYNFFYHNASLPSRAVEQVVDGVANPVELARLKATRKMSNRRERKAVS